jgi:putative membrane protein
MFGMVLFWAVVVVGIVWLARGAPTSSPTTGRRETPLEILDRRFAAGAISADEYRERCDVLTGTAPTSQQRRH